MPGFDGLIWWISLAGTIGTLNLDTDTIQMVKTGLFCADTLANNSWRRNFG